MHALHHCGNFPHNYGDTPDPMPVLEGEEIADTRDLPGFVERNVTYESHHFWVHFTRYRRRENDTRDESERSDAFVYIRVHHGGGWEIWRGDYMLAAALRRYGNDDRGLFLLCWYLIDIARNARQIGAQETAHEWRHAYLDKRIRRRSYPARGVVKVWIEPSNLGGNSARVAQTMAPYINVR